MKNYKIVKEEYHNRYGEVITVKWKIKKYKTVPVLNIKYWGYVCHEECDPSGCYEVPTEFKSLLEAEEFIEEVLCPEIPRTKWKTTEIKSISCE